MGMLVIRLDSPCSAYILENQQLILAKVFDPANVNQLLDDVGDYPISEVCVYVKPDSRSDLEGLQIDHIISEVTDYNFFVSDGDHDFIKAVAFKFGASVVKYYSAFRYYQALTTDGVVVDYYTDHNFIVANILDGLYRSIAICSPERLQKTVASCRTLNISYVSKGAIPELHNINNIPVELQESLAFLQFIMFGKPSCEINVDSGEILSYGDVGDRPEFYSLSEDERTSVMEAVKSNLTPTVVKKKRTFSLVDVGVCAAYLIAAFFLALSIFTNLKISDDFGALETKRFEQSSAMRKLEIEKDYLADSIENFGKDGVYTRLMKLDEVVNNGSIMNVRFIVGGLEVTLFVTDEAMKDRAVRELESYYTVDAALYEKDVKDQVSGLTFKQYNIALKYPK